MTSPLSNICNSSQCLWNVLKSLQSIQSFLSKKLKKFQNKQKNGDEVKNGSLESFELF